MRKARWIVLAAFAIILTLWLISSFNYPWTTYLYNPTGEVVEFFDRASGLYVDAVPVLVPDNPLWVDIIRKIAPFSLFVLGLTCIYFATEGRKRKGT